MGAARYKPYPAYKPSGVKWLGDIPEGWEVFYGKRLFANRRETARPEDEQLAASQAFGVVPQSVMMARNNAKVMLATKGTASFRHVEADDFVISLRSFEGGIEHSAYSGCVSPAYTVLQPLERLDPPYFRHLLKSTPFVSALQATTDSLRDGKSISYEQFGAIALNLPPLPEQTKIAAFLDYETGKIDALIAKQEQLIALLEEKRQAVISHAVTKGLNPNAPLRPSGIDWLGDVPEHWEVKPFKHICYDGVGIQMGPFGGMLTDLKSVDTGYKLFGQVNTITSDFHVGERYISKRQYRELMRYKLTAGDLVLTRKGSIGNCQVVPKDAPIGIADSDTIRVQVDPKIALPTFVRLCLSEADFVAVQLELNKTGAILSGLNTSVIANLELVLPSLEEQASIMTFVDVQQERFSRTISSVEAAITLLKERRTALISAAVTGKIDVRDWQPPQPLSDTDLSTETLQEAIA